MCSLCRFVDMSIAAKTGSNESSSARPFSPRLVLNRHSHPFAEVFEPSRAPLAEVPLADALLSHRSPEHQDQDGTWMHPSAKKHGFDLGGDCRTDGTQRLEKAITTDVGWIHHNDIQPPKISLDLTLRKSGSTRGTAVCGRTDPLLTFRAGGIIVQISRTAQQHRQPSLVSPSCEKATSQGGGGVVHALDPRSPPRTRLTVSKPAQTQHAALPADSTISALTKTTQSL